MVRGIRAGMKPATPMHGSKRPKQAHSRPQRRRRFHSHPKNTTHTTTTRPHTDLHETHNTNAQRPTLTFETHNTNAPLQPPKTGLSMPAKATPVSTGPPHQPAKAMPVSQASRHHCHLELRTAQSHLSLTGSGRHPHKGRTLATKKMFHARFTLTAPSGHGHRRHHRAHSHSPSPPNTGEAANHGHGRSVRVGGVRREEWGHGR